MRIACPHFKKLVTVPGRRPPKPLVLALYYKRACARRKFSWPACETSDLTGTGVGGHIEYFCSIFMMRIRAPVGVAFVYIINLRRACAARVTVVVLCVCVCVCVCLRLFSDYRLRGGL